jgi:hypothetical protein
MTASMSESPMAASKVGICWAGQLRTAAELRINALDGGF